MILENVKFIFVSFLSGLTAVIPGVSGGTIFAIFDISEKLSDDINAIVHNILTIKKNNISSNISNLRYHYKLPLIIGVGSLISSIFYSSLIVKYGSTYANFLSFFFIGLVLFSLPTLWKETKLEKSQSKIRYFYFIVAFLFSVVIFKIDNLNSVEAVNYNSILFLLEFFIVSLIAGFTTILPGISGTNILILGGVFDSYILFSSNIPSYFIQYGIYLFATILGSIFAAKFFTILFSNFRRGFYSIMSGLTASTVVFIWINPLNNFVQSILGFFLAYIIIKFLVRKEV